MPHDPQVTIWIPSYNHGRFLAATLDSALAQTFADTEVVVVDDGSTDGSFDIARAYAARHPGKVRVFTHPGRQNRGISETVNLAFEKSRGQFLSPLPSDDLLHPEKVERQLAFLEARPELGWVCGPMSFIDEEGGEPEGLRPVFRDFTRDPDPLESLIARNDLAGPTVLVRRAAFAAAGPFDPALVYSDWDFWVRLAAKARIGFLDVPLVKYRVHGSNTSVGVNMHLHARRLAEVFDSLRRRAASEGGLLGRARTRALLDLQAAYFKRLAGDEAGAGAALAAAFETDPTLGGSPDYFTSWLRERLRDLGQAPVPGVTGQALGAWFAGRLPQAAGGGLARRAAAVGLAGAAVESFHTDLGRARRLALRCLAKDPSWLGDAELRAVLLRGLAGEGLMRGLRRLKKSVRGPERA